MVGDQRFYLTSSVDTQPEGPQGLTRAALFRRKKWRPGQIIEINFLDGDPYVHERVREAARIWTHYANLTFEFRAHANGAGRASDSDIRIAFDLRGGCWSVIGTDCRAPRYRGKSTMNFGWLTHDTSDEECLAVVLHEFGHALGLIHEHQQPASGIQWNREAILAQLSVPPHCWTDADVEFNIIRAFTDRDSNYTDFDPDSIMIYPIPATWTLDGYSVAANTTLSAVDKRFLSEEYP